jgi:hypothetical protein
MNKFPGASHHCRSADSASSAGMGAQGGSTLGILGTLSFPARFYGVFVPFFP